MTLLGGNGLWFGGGSRLKGVIQYTITIGYVVDGSDRYYGYGPNAAVFLGSIAPEIPASHGFAFICSNFSSYYITVIYASHPFRVVNSVFEDLNGVTAIQDSEVYVLESQLNRLPNSGTTSLTLEWL